jgi:hypothetical protein
MVLGGLACLLHGFLPFLFERTGSRCIQQLHGEMMARRTGSVSAGLSAIPRAQ